MSQLTHPNIRYYAPQLTVPVVALETRLAITIDITNKIITTYEEPREVRTTTVVATFFIPDRGLGILTKDYLYLPDMRNAQ